MCFFFFGSYKASLAKIRASNRFIAYDIEFFGPGVSIELRLIFLVITAFLVFLFYKKAIIASLLFMSCTGFLFVSVYETSSTAKEVYKDLKGSVK